MPELAKFVDKSAFIFHYFKYYYLYLTAPENKTT